jgi:hypothetical protein
MRKQILEDGIETLATTFQVFQADQWVSDMVGSLWDYAEVRRVLDVDAKRILKAALSREKLPNVGQLLKMFRADQSAKGQGVSVGCARCVSGLIQVRTQLQVEGREPGARIESMVACPGCNRGLEPVRLEERWRELAEQQGASLILCEWGSPWLVVA